jgi:hypothetical protein
MTRTLFIGDSHTCGYKTKAGEVGPDSFTNWNDNSYVLEYAKLNNKKCIVYAMPGASIRQYTDYIRAMFNKYNDIDEVFVLLSSLNRFTLSFNQKLSPDIVPVDHFTHDVGTTEDGLVDRYMDKTIEGDYFQLYQKPHQGDYENFPGLKFSYEQGLTEPDIRKSSYMDIKTFFELNTHLEQRDFFKDIYVWDNMCADYNVPLYLFKMRERTFFPEGYEFYGKLKNTTIADQSIELYFQNKQINHEAYFLEDKEHYNTKFHNLIAKNYIKHLTKT